MAAAMSLMMLLIGNANSQERLTVTNEKPGKLSKQLPNKTRKDLKELVVIGAINGKDLLEIYSLPALKSLDLSQSVLQDFSAISEDIKKPDFYLPANIFYEFDNGIIHF